MSNSEIGGILTGLAFLAFLPVFGVYVCHARSLTCRVALIVFVALYMSAFFFSHGVVVGLLCTLGLLLLPAAAGFLCALTARGLLKRTERRHGFIGVEYTYLGTIREMYRVVWASDH